MNATIVYRPYQTESCFAGMMFVIGMLSVVAFGYCLTDFGPVCYFFAIIGIVSLWLAKVFYDSSNVSVLFELEGIRVVGGRHNNYYFWTWDKCVYAYYVRNYKGHLFLVMSPQVLNLKQAKSLANRSANTYKVCVDTVCIVHLNSTQTSAMIKDLINKTVPYVDNYQQ